jgi:glycine cleavage system regulatory protein
MKRTLVMTLIGDDRPGLVDRLASVVAAGGGNWLESRMSHLAGKFAGILRIEVAESEAADLSFRLRALASEGIRVNLEASEAPASASEEKGRSAVLEVVGQDRPGIVSQISHALAVRGANVEELHSECASAPMSGEILFRARVSLVLPSDLDLATLQAEVEKVAADLMVDVRFGE